MTAPLNQPPPATQGWAPCPAGHAVQFFEFPFAGRDLRRVRCDECGWSGPLKTTEAEAIAAWNFRGKSSEAQTAAAERARAERYEKRIAELEEGLRAFADLSDRFRSRKPGWEVWMTTTPLYNSVFVRVSDFRRAAALLADSGPAEAEKKEGA